MERRTLERELNEEQKEEEEELDYRFPMALNVAEDRLAIESS